MTIQWEKFPHGQISLKIYKSLDQHDAERSSESSLRDILRRKLLARHAQDHQRFVELEAARLIQHLRCTRDAYQNFVDEQKCRPAIESHWVVLRCAVLPAAVELLRQAVIEYTKLTRTPARDLSLLFGIPTGICCEDLNWWFGVLGPPDLEDNTAASDAELESLGRLVNEDALLHFDDIKDGGAIFQPLGGGPFAADDQGSIERSWSLCGLRPTTLIQWMHIREKLWRFASPWTVGLVDLFAAVQQICTGSE